MRKPLITLINVSKTYTMGEVAVPALRPIELSVMSGEFLVIVGPSGSGKSTLLNIMGGMDVPSTGKVLYDNADIAQFNEAERTRFRRKAVGFVFQFYNLIPNLTAKENVEVATEIASDPMPSMEALALVGLADRADHYPSQLSGGEQQRVAIARAIAKNPKLLLCDEPTGALDFETGKRILAVLQEVNRATGTTVVVITHNSPIAQMGHRVVRMRSGYIAEIRENQNPASAEEIVW